MIHLLGALPLHLHIRYLQGAPRGGSAFLKPPLVFGGLAFDTLVSVVSGLVLVGYD